MSDQDYTGRDLGPLCPPTQGGWTGPTGHLYRLPLVRSLLEQKPSGSSDLSVVRFSRGRTLLCQETPKGTLRVKRTSYRSSKVDFN